MKIKKISAINETIATMERELKERKTTLAWVKKHRHLFDELGITGQFWGASVDFNCLPHNQVVKVMRTFKAGKWDKRPSAQDARVDYTATFDGKTIRCYAGEPPPSCHIVEELVMVPSRQEIVRKLVCPKAAITQVAT